MCRRGGGVMRFPGESRHHTNTLPTRTVLFTVTHERYCAITSIAWPSPPMKKCRMTRIVPRAWKEIQCYMESLFAYAQSIRDPRENQESDADVVAINGSYHLQTRRSWSWQQKFERDPPLSNFELLAGEPQLTPTTKMHAVSLHMHWYTNNLVADAYERKC